MNTIKFITGTGLYSGLIPKAPGTAGSLAVLFPLYFMLQYDSGWPVILAVAATSALCLFVSGYFEEHYGKDPEILVMDEWAGQSLTFFTISLAGTLQHQIIILLTGFVLFRFFDILKPLGIKKLQDLPGGWGILVDDLLAGLYALLCLKTLIFTWPKIFGMA